MEFSLEDIDRLSPKYVNSLFKINDIIASKKAVENKFKIINLFYKANILNQNDRKFVENDDFKNLYMLPLRQLVRISKNITFTEAKKKGLTRGQIVKKIILERLIMERRREYIKIPPEISEIIFSDLDINTIKKLLATQYFVLPEKYYKIIENIKSYNISSPEKNYYKVLYKASEKGHIDVIKYLVNQHHGIMTLRVENSRLLRTVEDVLELASENGHLNVVKYLMEEQKINLVYSSALKKAIKRGHLNIVKYFIDNIKVKIYLEKALLTAIQAGQLDIVKYLITKGATMDSNSLIYASKEGHLNVVKYLIEEHGLKIYSIVLRVASEKGYLDIVKYLVENGVKINRNILKAASKEGHLNVVKYLISNSSETIIDDDILKETLARDHIKVVKYLMKKKYSDTTNLSPESNYFNIAKVI